MTIIDKFITKIKTAPEPIRIVFPEGNNALIQEAAAKLVENNIQPILMFDTPSSAEQYNLPQGVKTVILSETDTKVWGDRLYNYRKNKLTPEDAQKLVTKANYLGVMMVKEGDADGMVGGIVFATKDIILPALQIIKPRPELKTVSAITMMIKGDHQYIFTDCALMLYPSSEQLVGIAKLGYEAASMFQIKDPNLAFLSYSTAGSGKGSYVDVVHNAVEQLRESGWNKCPFDGEMQFDSAIDLRIRNKKYPNSVLDNKPANILVFPNLDAGNIGYKIAQGFGGFQVTGPIIMGLAKPVNDLSRGATALDIFRTAVTTAYDYLINHL